MDTFSAENVHNFNLIPQRLYDCPKLKNLKSFLLHLKYSSYFSAPSRDGKDLFSVHLESFGVAFKAL